MPTLDVQRLKEEVEKHEKTLSELSKRWDDDSVLKRLAKNDQPLVVRAVVSAKRLANILIPKLKFKFELSIKSPCDPKLQANVAEEWKILKPKIESTLRDFEMVESGKKLEYPSKEQKQRDLEMSKNIEKSLKSKRSGTIESSVTESSNANFPEDGSGDMGRHVKDFGEAKSKNLGTGDGSSSSTRGVNDGKQLDYGPKLVENVRSFKEQLCGQRNTEKLANIVEDVCPDDAASVKQYIKSLAASETVGVDNFLSQEMLDEIRGFDAEESDRRKAERNQRLAKSREVREQRIQKLEKLAEVEPMLTRPSLPSPLPIDGFLDLVETLPGEIQKLVSKETEELAEYYENQVFMKKPPLSSHTGELISMNKLKKGLRDDRFDASDFHIRAAESSIAEEHMKRLKEHRVDNAVGRFFGTFSSKFDSDNDEHDSVKYAEDEADLSVNNVE